MTIFYIGNVNAGADQTTQLTLARGDMGYIAAGADLVVTNSTAISYINSGTGPYAVQIDGGVFGANGLDWRGSATDNGYITIGTTGRLVAAFVPLYIQTMNASILNNGEITHVGTGHSTIDFRGASLNLVNHGTISGNTYTMAIAVSASVSANIENYGTITTTGSGAVQIYGAQPCTMLNAGTISGHVGLGSGNDTFNGRDGYVYGVIDGGAGDDTLIGGRSVDRLYGGNGNDTIWFSIEDAVVSGGNGYDVARNTYNDFGLTFDMGGISIEAYYGSEAGETIVTTANVRMDVDAGGGNDLIIGSAQGDGIAGGNGDDEIFGNGGPDTLAGGNGNDRITGGEGADVLFGEAGNDTFIYNGVGDAGDQIMDFEIGRDRIEILRSGFDFSLGIGTLAANRLVAGPANQAFGQFLIDTGTGNVFWDGDGTGAGAATFLFRATGGLNHTDFVVV